MGDTDVNVYPACNATHFMGGFMVDPGVLSIRVHLGAQALDTTLNFAPPLGRSLLMVAAQVGPNSWPSSMRPGKTEQADFAAINEVLLRHPQWFGIEQSLGPALRDSALKSLVMALRYPLG